MFTQTPEYLFFICNTIKERLLKNGTTTASYFATIHYDATVVLCDVIGQYERVSPLGAFSSFCSM